ncbi:hypothetical protein [Lentilactobacillus senioris]|nr:hypothetical protein [Lentilactobacillus senioris]
MTPLNKSAKKYTNRVQPIGVVNNFYKNIITVNSKPKLTIWQRLGGLIHG